MLQSVKSQFSEEDYQLMEANDLGNPLRVYRPKQSYTIFNRILYLILFIAFIISLIVIILIALPSLELPNNFLPWFKSQPGILTVSILILIVIGGWYLFIGWLHEEQSLRILVGEHGLLQAKKIIWNTSTEVVHWKDIQTVEKAFVIRDYSIRRKRGEPFTLSGYTYRDVDRLVAFIQERMSEVEISQRRTQFEEIDMPQDRAYWAEHGEWPDWLTEDERHWYETHPE